MACAAASIVAVRASPHLKAAIAGRVVDPASREAVEDAGVQLVYRRRAIWERRQATTDEDGRFEFTVPAGTYYLAAYSRSRPPVFHSATPRAVNEPGDAISVAAGERHAEIEILLAAGGVVSGSVRDADGNPASAIVFVKRVRAPDPVESGFVLETSASPGQTDARGAFRIYGIPSGDYVLSAVPLGSTHGPEPAMGRRRAYVETYYPDVIDRRAAGVISVASGQEVSGLDLAIRSSEMYRVRGVTTDPNSVSDKPQWSSGSTRLASVGDPSNVYRWGFAGTGQWSFEVPPGDYLAIAAKGSFGGSPGEQSGFWGWTRIALGPGDVDGIHVLLRPALTMSGRLVGDAPGSPPVSVDGASLKLLGFRENPFSVSQHHPVAAGPDGRFVLRNIPPGRYRLVVRLKSDELVAVAATAIDGRVVEGPDVEIGEEAPREFVVWIGRK
jgi:hypothetical protein